MARIGVSVEDDGFKKLVVELLAQANDQRRALELVGRKVKTKIQLGFKFARSPLGVPWKPLKFRQGQPLSDTRRLANSISSNVGQDYVDVGTNVKYARVHQFGATIVPVTADRLRFVNKLTGGFIFAKKVVIPPRPFMPVSRSGLALPAAWESDVLGTLRDHILKQQGQA